MNLLGKILTGLICVMSILFLAFALAVYATHREWDELVNNPPGSTPVGLKTQLANALEEGNQLKEDLDESLNKLAIERASRTMALARLESERQRLQQDLVEREMANQQLTEQARQATATLQTAQANLAALKEEVDKLRNDIRVAQEDRDAQFDEVVLKTDLYNQAQSNIKALQARVEQLTERIGRQASVLDKNNLNEFGQVFRTYRDCRCVPQACGR